MRKVVKKDQKNTGKQKHSMPLPKREPLLVQVPTVLLHVLDQVRKEKKEAEKMEKRKRRKEVKGKKR